MLFSPQSKDVVRLARAALLRHAQDWLFDFTTLRFVPLRVLES
ncbi:MAG: hypothetical protein AAB217_08005 [Chloroflexota bacterium]